MRRVALVFLLVLVVTYSFIGNISPVFAAGAQTPTQQSGFNLISDILTIFPQDQIDKAKAEGYDPKFAKYPPSHYGLEITFEDRKFWEVNDQLSDSGYFILHGMVNFIWQSLLVWDFTVILIVENAYSLDIVNSFADAVQVAVQQLAGFNGTGYGHSGIIGNFLLFMIIFGGSWIAYVGIIQRRSSVAIGAMLKMILILILGLTFFANAGGILRYLNQISSGLSQEVMGVGVAFQHEMDKGQGPQYPTDVSGMVVSDKLYNMLVYEPYLMLQYGKTSHDPQLTQARIDKILAQQRGSTARAQAVLDEKNGDPAHGIPPNPMVTTAGVFERLTLLLILCVAHLILGALFILIAGSMLVYQFMFIFVALFAPFAFLLALHPAMSSIANAWFRKLIGYQIIKLLIGVFLTMLLTLSQFLYTMNPPERTGYVWTIAMQLILVVGVVWKRHELLAILQAPMHKDNRYTGQINIQMPLSYVQRYTDSLAQKVRSVRIKK